MPGPPAGPHSDVTVNGQHTHASARPQPQKQQKQHQHNFARSPVNPRLPAPPRQRPDVASSTTTASPTAVARGATSLSHPSNTSIGGGASSANAGARSSSSSILPSSPHIHRRNTSATEDHNRAASGLLDPVASRNSFTDLSAVDMLRREGTAARAASEASLSMDNVSRSAPPASPSQPRLHSSATGASISIKPRTLGTDLAERFVVDPPHDHHQGLLPTRSASDRSPVSVAAVVPPKGAEVPSSPRIKKEIRDKPPQGPQARSQTSATATKDASRNPHQAQPQVQAPTQPKMSQASSGQASRTVVASTSSTALSTTLAPAASPGMSRAAQLVNTLDPRFRSLDGHNMPRNNEDQRLPSNSFSSPGVVEGIATPLPAPAAQAQVQVAADSEGGAVDQIKSISQGVATDDSAAAPGSESVKSHVATNEAISQPKSIAQDDADDPAATPHIQGSLASFELIDYETLFRDVGNGKVRMMSAASCFDFSEEDLEETVMELVETDGEPFVIKDLHKTPAWDSEVFDPQKLLKSVQELRNKGHTEELHGKDQLCPPGLTRALAKPVFRRFEYHGEQDAASNIGPSAHRTQTFRFDPGPACTPLKMELCSSLGQSLMIWGDPGAYVMVVVISPNDTDAVDEFLSKKGGDLQSKRGRLSVNDLAKGHFSMSAWKQRVGDLVLIPPRAYYMAFSTGGGTMTASWPRLTLESLRSALSGDLPLYQRRCQYEFHHIKQVVERTLIAYNQQVNDNLEQRLETPTAKIRDLRDLLQLYDAILCDEYVPEWRDIKVIVDDVDYVECDFCGADVLHAFFDCPKGHTLCAHCYCQGRLCGCSDAVEALKPVQLLLSFGQRLEFRNQAAKALLSADPTLALTAEQRINADDEDEEDEEPPILQVELLLEEDVGRKSWPLSFLAAVNLYKLRQTPGWRDDVAPCRICKATLDLSQRYFCKPCGHSYCYGCLLHKMYIHPAHVLAQDEPKLFHSYHKKASTLDYKEWKQDPFEFRDEARAHFAFIEAAKTNMKCAPLNSTCRIGFLDVSDQYEHGLSGTLGVKRVAKARAFEKDKVVEAPSSSASASVSRKRMIDSSQSVPEASAKPPLRKKVRIEAPTLLQPIDEDAALAQPTRARDAIDMSGMAAAPDWALQADLQGAASTSSHGTQLSPHRPVTPLPTVANGIRKFIVREGKVHALSPTSSVSPSMSPLPTAKVVPSRSSTAAPTLSSQIASPTPKNGPGNTGPIDKATASVAKVPDLSIAAPEKAALTGSAPPTDLMGHTHQTNNVVGGAKLIGAGSGTVPNKVTNVAISTAQPSTSSSLNASIPPSAGRARTVDPGGLAMATSVVATGITASQAPPAASSPNRSLTGLESIDPMTLRVVTQILRIYSQANDKRLEDHVANIQNAQAKHVEEQMKAQSKVIEMLQQTSAKLEATLLGRIDKLSTEVTALTREHTAEVKALRKKHELEVARLRQRLDEVDRQQTSSNVRVDKMHDRFQGFLDDIERQAQATLQAELSTHSHALGSGGVLSGDGFVPLSNAR